MPETGASPYVGPRAFTAADRSNFFGREREVRQLQSLAVARRVVLLYAPSGAGKTSLLEAGLLPRLRALREVTVLPTARVGGVPAPGTEPANVYSASTLSYLLGGEGAEAAGLTLAAGLALCLEREPAEHRPRPHFLVLDQLEELFTAHPARHADRPAFLRELRDALALHPQVTLMLSMREDYIAQLDPFRSLLPDHLRHRFRLELLGTEAAREAVVEPARAAGVDFHDGTAARLVDELRTIRVQAADGSPLETLGPTVEPVQLQVVCRRLWERREQGTIGDAALTAEGGVDQALARYYSEQVAAVAASSGVRERQVRDWIEDHLITRDGLRGQVLREPESTQGLPDAAVRALVGSHLVRAEERRGAVWFELSHDRLIAPVRTDNAAWREAHLTPLERRAALWDQEGRPAGLLLSGTALPGAGRSAAGLGPIERDFLDACRRARAQVRRRRLTLAVLLLAGIACLAALGSHREARREQEQAFVQGLAAQSRLLREDRLDLALLLALEAGRRGAPDAPALLFEALAASPHLTTLLHGHTGDVLDLAWSPDGRRLASAGADGTLVLWDQGSRHPLRGHTGRVWGIDWSPDGRWLASAGEDGAVLLWDLAATPPRPRRLTAPASPEQVYTVRFSPDGRTLAAATSADLVRRWDRTTGRPLEPPLAGPRDWVTSLAFSPDGETLAAGGMDRTVRRWDTATGAPLGLPLTGPAEGVTGLAFSPDGETLAATSLDGILTLWDATGHRLRSPAFLATGSAQAPAWSPGGRLLATGYADGGIFLWDVREARLATRPLTGQRTSLRRLAFSPDGRTLAAGHGPAVALWSVHPAPPLSTAVSLALDEVTALAAGPDRPALAVAGRNPAGQGPAVRLLGAPGGRSLLTGHDQRLSALAWGPDRTLAAADLDRGLYRWDLATGKLDRRSLPGNGRLTSLAFSPDTRILAAAGQDRTLRLWDLRSGRPRGGPLAGHTDRISCLAWSHDGATLASGSGDGAVRLWSATGAPLGSPLAASGGPPVALALSPDGSVLATAGRDRRIFLWQTATGAPLAGPFTGHADTLSGLAFEAGGRTLVSVSVDGVLQRWDVDPASWRRRACRLVNRDLTPAERERFLAPGPPLCPSGS